MEERRDEGRGGRQLKGRGALSNRSGRFEPETRDAFDDGWPREEEAPPATVLLPDRSKSILSRNNSPDIPFERSINPYRGCEHGCIYCYARPTHAYLGLSPGLDFETRLFFKEEAAKLLRAELAKPGYRPTTLAIGGVTDPYQPIERKLKITRSVLEVLREARHPFTLVTKSAGVLRDLDILRPMAAEGLAQVCLSVTTLDRTRARRLEPRAPAPERRLAAIRALSEAGVPVAVLSAPMIPALNDQELEAILEKAAEAGATAAGYVLLRLPLEIAPLFEEWLSTHFPDRRRRVLDILRETRGGKLYDSTWGQRMRGEGVYAELIRRRFELAEKRLGLNRRSWQLDSSRFRRPAPDGQLALL